PAGRAALDTEHGPQRGLAEADDRAMAEALERHAETDRDHGLSFPMLGRRHRAHEYESSPPGSPREGTNQPNRDLQDSGPGRQQVVSRQAEVFRDGGDRSEGAEGVRHPGVRFDPLPFAVDRGRTEGLDSRTSSTSWRVMIPERRSDRTTGNRLTENCRNRCQASLSGASASMVAAGWDIASRTTPFRRAATARCSRSWCFGSYPARRMSRTPRAWPMPT